MRTGDESRIQEACIVDLPHLSTNFPLNPRPELLRDNVVSTLKNLLAENIYSVSVEGPEGIGKTTILSQFARATPTNAISTFVSSANRLSYDVDLVRRDLAVQVYWALTGDVLRSGLQDAALLKTYYGDLQREARRKQRIVYFVIDGIEELEVGSREVLLQALSDVLPIGYSMFRFIFSGDEALYKRLFSETLQTKTFPLTEFGIEEIRALFGRKEIPVEVARELNEVCRGLPGRLAAVLRALDRGESIEEFLREAPSKWPEFFEQDWKQVASEDEELKRILALLAHDARSYTATGVSSILDISEDQVNEAISRVNFLSADCTNRTIHFASPGLRKYVAEQLKDRKSNINKLLIRRLLDQPNSEEAVLDLPEYMETAGDYSDLLDLLTPDRILDVLARSRTLSRVDSTVLRGFRSAKKLDRDPDMLRFGIQKSIIAELAASAPWESEVAALVALRRDKEALALANDAMLREDRLQMLVALAQGIWLRGDIVPPELIDQVRLLIDKLDYWSLGARAREIASKLICVSPDLATTMLKKAKHGASDGELDRAFAHMTVSALGGLDDERRDLLIKTAAKSPRDSGARGLLQGVRVLIGRLSPSEVCAMANDIEETDARLSILRYWCALHGATQDADVVASHAIKFALATTSVSLDAALLADLSTALGGAADTASRRELIGTFDGIRATAERLGPSVDFARLQLRIGVAEATTDIATAEGRLTDLLDYIARITDLPSRGESYALFLGALKDLGKIHAAKFVDELERQAAAALEAVVLTLCDSTAEQHAALGGVITGLAIGDIEKALDYTRVVNTESRRDAILGDVVTTLIRRPISQIDINSLKKALVVITGREARDNSLLAVVERFAEDQAATQEQTLALKEFILSLPSISDSVLACRACVCALKLLRSEYAEELQSVRRETRKALRERWKHIDVQWARIDAGFGMARDLATVDKDEATAILDDTERLKAEVSIAAHRPASAYVLCVRLVIRALCGLLPKRLETEKDLKDLSALIEVLPSFGEQAVLWADLCMRAASHRRADLTARLVADYVQPAFGHVPIADSAYRARVLVHIAPALYTAHPKSCHEALNTLSGDDRDSAVRQIIRFLVSGRVPFDPVDDGPGDAREVKYETLLQVESLTAVLDTDWMIYDSIDLVANCLSSPKNKHSITIPQREDISSKFSTIAKIKLPSSRHITHKGYLIITLAKALSIKESKPAEWASIIEQAQALENIADRVYVMQAVALSLPKNMSTKKEQMLKASCDQIVNIPWDIDKIDRYVGLAEKLQGGETARCRELVNHAAKVMSGTNEDLRVQRRRLVDVAYRLDTDFARQLIDAFDDDEAKRLAQAQVRLLEIRKSITDTDGKADQVSALTRVKSGEVARLGWLLVRSLSAGRFQSYHPKEIRNYVELAAEQPLSRSYSLLCWYVENSVVKYSNTPQASSFIRPVLTACVIGAALAGKIAGQSLVRLKALRRESNELSSSRSLLCEPGSREEALSVVSNWLEGHPSDNVLIYDPYFGPDDLDWVQLVRVAIPDSAICVMTSRQRQPKPTAGVTLEDLYVNSWHQKFDQEVPKVEIAVIGGEDTGMAPIHDRWLLVSGTGLRFGTSLNSLGIHKESEVSELSPYDAEQVRAKLDQYLSRGKVEHRGEKLRLLRFYL